MCVNTHPTCRMSDSENDATNDHPFVIFDNPGDIGCNQDYISGDLELTEQMTTLQQRMKKSCSCASVLWRRTAEEKASRSAKGGFQERLQRNITPRRLATTRNTLGSSRLLKVIG